MCGRFYIEPKSADEKLAEILEKAMRRHPDITFHTGDFYPGEQIPILYGEKAKIYADYMLWGIPLAKKKLINARQETVAQKPFFRDHFYERRCLIPATGFYEWSSDKKAYRFGLEHNDALYMAGIYTPQRQLVILTTFALAPVLPIHPRMPVLISREHIKDWLSNPSKATHLLQSSGQVLSIQSL